MKYTLRQLQVFLATAQHDNISQAANNLHLSQSAASSALKELESQMGVKLFDRAGKRLKLNDQGKLLRPRVESLLCQAEELEKNLMTHAQAGPITVGATLTIGNYLAVDIMSQYMADDPAASVKLEVANTKTIAEKVKNFELDIGLVEGEIHDTDLEIQTWMEDELVAFCAPSHPLAGNKNLTDDEIVEQTWIIREYGSGTRQAFEHAMHGMIPKLQMMELQHTEAIKRAVAANLGVGCLSLFTLKEDFERGYLCPLKIPHRDFSRFFYFILHKNKYRSSGISRWLTLCNKTSEKLNGKTVL